jgi:hypothetical protein
MLKDSPHKFVYNLFKFLEKKKGTKTPLRVKFLYAPEEITDEDLNVEGDLDLAYTSITSIPDNLQVGGSLDLENTNIETLPNNLKVERSLFLDNTPLAEEYTKEEIRKMVEDKGGYVKRDIYV